MSIGALLTNGLGSFGNVNLIITLGLSVGEEAEVTSLFLGFQSTVTFANPCTGVLAPQCQLNGDIEHV